MNPQEISYIIFGIIIIATFISVFFFTYVSKVEGDIVKIQMKKIVDDLVDGSDLIFTPDQRKLIGDNIISKINIPDMTDDDNRAASNNDQLKRKAFKIFGSVILVGLAVIFFLYVKYKISLGEILKYSIITLIAVAVTEYLFVTEITKNYQIVDPNYVRYLIVENLKNYANHS